MSFQQYVETTSRLANLYEDKEGERKSEIQALSGPNEFTEFYSRLKSIKEFHKKHPDEVSIPLSTEFEQMAKTYQQPDALNLLVEFTDEESYGRYLDLHESYDRYINLKGVEKIDYITYLMIFDHLYDIQKDRKNAEYKKYVEFLFEYLYGFTQRIKPLLDINKNLDQVKVDFEKQWIAGTFLGWPKETESALANVGAALDLSAFTNWEELASLGLDRLKSALLALGLKCGGTLEERAQRLFSTKGMKQIDQTLLSKKNALGKNATRAAKEQDRQREIALIEAQIYHLSEFLKEQRIATKENVQRKQARGDGERNESDEGSDSESEEEEDDNDGVPYNPKNLPLGWDGKPIPYWLYKLHGLNINYNCEICGNYTYKGPKAFQRHFSEWRHAHGMRCLGIPNTAHFANVTQIEDAIQLWEKIKQQKNQERWVPEQNEEFEDSLGNVVTKKTYEDLKRQGLL